MFAGPGQMKKREPCRRGVHGVGYSQTNKGRYCRPLHSYRRVCAALLSREELCREEWLIFALCHTIILPLKLFPGAQI